MQNTIPFIIVVIADVTMFFTILATIVTDKINLQSVSRWKITAKIMVIITFAINVIIYIYLKKIGIEYSLFPIV